MKYSGIYLVPNPSGQLEPSLKLLEAFSSKIESSFPRAIRQGSWELKHRLLRDVPPRREPNDPSPVDHPPTYQHLIFLSHVSSSRTFNVIQPPPPHLDQHAPMSEDSTKPETATIETSPAFRTDAVISIPLSQTDSYLGLVTTQFAPLWSLQRLYEIPSSSGTTYTLGSASNFTVHIGDLRSRRQGPQSGAVLSPGVIVCITTDCGSSDNNDTAPGTEELEMEAADFDDVQAGIREVWKTVKTSADVQKVEPREYMQAPRDVSGNEEKGREETVKLWCKALRPKS